MFAAVCDKLIDTDAKNDFVPQLATAWTWSPDNLALTLTLRDGVRFQDGAPMDADAVARQPATLPLRAGKRAQVGAEAGRPSVEVIDPHTVRLHLSQPYAPLVAVLADRAGMMVSPAGVTGDVTQKLPCAGPFKLTERVAQDRIVVDRFPGYWNARAIHLDRIVYQPQPDTTVRLVNLQAGPARHGGAAGPERRRHGAQEPEAETGGADGAGVLLDQHQPGEQGAADQSSGARGAGGGDRPGRAEPGGDRRPVHSVQPVRGAGQPLLGPRSPSAQADVAKAKALLQQAGMPHPAFTLLVGNSSVEQQEGVVLQSMAAEAGFVVKLQAAEANAQVASARAGEYDATVVIWSGRPDPDGNVAIWLQCDGFLNWGKYCNPAFDALLAKARGVTDIAARQAAYRQVVDVYLHDRPHIVLYHARWLWALSDKVSGFVPTPDGLIRPQGMAIAP